VQCIAQVLGGSYVLPAIEYYWKSYVDVLAVHDPKDPTCLTDDLRAKLMENDPALGAMDSEKSLQGIRIGIPQASQDILFPA
jgi:hypothetical protein